MLGSLLKQNSTLRKLLSFLVSGLLLLALALWLLGRWGDTHLLGAHRENQFMFGMLGLAAIYIAMTRKRMDWIANLLFLFGLGLELLLFVPWDIRYKPLMIATCNLGILFLLVISTLRRK